MSRPICLIVQMSRSHFKTRQRRLLCPNTGYLFTKDSADICSWAVLDFSCTGWLIYLNAMLFYVNSLATERFQWNLRKIIFKLILVTDGGDISSKIVLRWISRNLSDDKSILVQVLAWCHQASSHLLNQCWTRSRPPYGATRPQWVNDIWLELQRNHLCKRYAMGYIACWPWS